MLQASIHNTSQLAQKRYHVHSPCQEGLRRTQEDEITSIVFGAMDFMQPAEVLAIWQAILENQKVVLPDFPNTPPNKAVLNFWECHTVNVNGISRVIPDLRIDFDWPFGHHWILLIEIKWHAPLGKWQLQNQWEHALKPEERKIAHQIFLGNRIIDALAAVHDKDVWGADINRLIPITWSSVRQAFEQIIRKNKENDPEPVLVKYARHAAHFLKIAGITTFRGFWHLHSKNALPEYSISKNPIFWSGITGFKNFSFDLPSMEITSMTPLFFTPS